MVYLVFDNPSDKADMNFLDAYFTEKVMQVYPEKKLNSIKDMVCFCNECLKSVKDTDTIVFWYDFMGVISWWISQLKFIKPRIIVLNLLLKDKKTVRNFIAKLLYSPIIKSKNVITTVTSVEYGNKINEMFNCDKKHVLLHDIYHGGYECDREVLIEKGTVFCGGRNGRDWSLVFEIASKMPDVIFNCVMPRVVYEKYKNVISTNVNTFCDVPKDEFLRVLASSEFVVMPLDTEAPAGLISFFQAAANNKLIITNKTVTTLEYLGNERGVLLDETIANWESAISYYLNNVEAQKIASRFKEFLELHCSEQNYATTLNSIIFD